MTDDEFARRLAEQRAQRRVVCAANQDPAGGALIIGARHWDMLMHTQAEQWPHCKFSRQGFIDQHGLFMTRQEAWRVAMAAGQIIQRVGSDGANGGTLYSENLY